MVILNLNNTKIVRLMPGKKNVNKIFLISKKSINLQKKKNFKENKL